MATGTSTSRASTSWRTACTSSGRTAERALGLSRRPLNGMPGHASFSARPSCALLALLALAGCGGGPAQPAAPAGNGAQPTAAAPASAAPRQPRPISPELHEAFRALQEHRYAEARELAQRVLDAHPAHPPAQEPTRGQAAYLIGLTFYQTGNYGAARPWLEQALELDPDNQYVHDFLGYSAFLLGDLAVARREYEALRSIDPGEPKAPY